METSNNRSSLAELITLQTAVCGMLKLMISEEQLPLQIEQLPVLLHVHHHGFACQQDVADAVFRDKSSIQRTIAKLERYGFLEIHKGKDKRKRLLTLSLRGKDVANKIMKFNTTDLDRMDSSKIIARLKYVIEDIRLPGSSITKHI